ncbi:hypothetical protein SDC9_199705 [bioreactor metagenome]|uniref:Uncharacterized protein n=1 Tax=bioreactor metagenome TaxID=1076179 RepID=A0A645IXW4_9ZZZZ
MTVWFFCDGGFVHGEDRHQHGGQEPGHHNANDQPILTSIDELAHKEDQGQRQDLHQRFKAGGHATLAGGHVIWYQPQGGALPQVGGKLDQHNGQ